MCLWAAIRICDATRDRFASLSNVVIIFVLNHKVGHTLVMASHTLISLHAGYKTPYGLLYG